MSQNNQNQTIQELIRDYYEKKGNYEKKRNNKVKQIIQSGLSKAEKKEMMNKFKMRCINCKREVGTNFFTKDKKLVAICGDEENPCDLHIEIDRGEHLYIPLYLVELSKTLERSKTDIIRLKLDILFGFSTEEEVEVKFVDQRQKFMDLEKILGNLQSIIKSNSLIKITDSLNNERVLTKKEFIQLEKIKLEKFISEFNQLLVEAENNPTRSKTYYQDALGIYINKIIPSLTNMQRVIYQIQVIIEEDEKFILTQIKTPIQKQMITIHDANIIRNAK
jgi:hypothetical protein